MISHLSLILAATALERVCLEVGNGNEPAKIAHVDTVGIGYSVEPLVKELGCSVSNLAVSLHLTKPQTTITVREHREKA